MIRSEKSLKGYRLAALDGHIGKVHDFLVGDATWGVRYMVADTGVWIPRRKVLIAPRFLGHPDGVERVFPVELTREQIEKSPDIETDLPVSMQHKREMLGYGWLATVPPEGLAVAAGYAPQRPLNEPVGVQPEPEPRPHGERDAPRAERLRSANEMRGYRVDANDGSLGHIDDFILDDEAWVVRYVVVDTRNWLPGRKVILSPGWIDWIRWEGQEAQFDLSRRQIETAPAYDPHQPVNRDYERRLYDFYGRPVYWDQ